MSKRNLITLSLSVATLISCTSSVCVRDILPELQPVVYKKINSSEFTCLSDEAYMKFRYNDVACKARIDTYRKNIKIHNNE